MLLDLSAAFDTVDQNEIGVTGVALKWFSSFLKGMRQRVKRHNTFFRIFFAIWCSSRLGPWTGSV